MLDPEKQIGDPVRSARITDSHTLALVLREARLESGLSQRELAQRMGVRQSYIADIETGHSTKAIDRLLAFARETGLSLHAEIDRASTTTEPSP